MPEVSGHRPAVVWDWSQEIWAWTPDLGRWSPEYGGPKAHASLEISTEGLPPREAYDYWRHIAYYYFDADSRPGVNSEGFEARAKALLTPRGDFFVYRSSAVSGRRTQRQIRADGGDGFDFGIVLTGSRSHRDETDGVTVSGPGDFFCYDAAKPSRVKWDNHRGLHLSLPRKLVEATVGSIPPTSVFTKALAASPLAPFLQAHLKVLAREIGSLSLADRAAIFDQTVDLVLTVLRQAVAGASQTRPGDQRAYFAAAKRIIHERLADPNLDAAMVARMLQCSRATLYRSFAGHGLTVAAYIREARLREAMRRLAFSSPQATIESLASECGFYDPSHFRRLFRARFGINPSDARALHSQLAQRDS